jgi:hypothetical protein
MFSTRCKPSLYSLLVDDYECVEQCSVNITSEILSNALGDIPLCKYETRTEV